MVVVDLLTGLLQELLQHADDGGEDELILLLQGTHNLLLFLEIKRVYFTCSDRSLNSSTVTLAYIQTTEPLASSSSLADPAECHLVLKS